MNAPRLLQRMPIDPVRITGTLSAPAELAPTVGREPHVVMTVRIQTAEGGPYFARVDLGTELADHMEAERLLPAMHTGAPVSVGGTHLTPRTEHGQATLQVRGARTLILLDPSHHGDTAHAA